MRKDNQNTTSRFIVVESEVNNSTYFTGEFASYESPTNKRSLYISILL